MISPQFSAGLGEEGPFSPEPRDAKSRERRMTRLVRILIVIGAALFSVGASAQGNVRGYPNRPITMIVPFGPGSATDTIARILAQHLGTALNQTIVVENKAGANGAMAAAQVARSAPDGYTLFLSTNSPHSAAPSLMKNVAYDPVKDFAPLSRVGSYTLILVLHPDVPARTIPELIALRQGQSGQAVIRQRQYLGRGGRRDIRALGRASISSMCPTAAPRRRSTTCSAAACR